MDAAAVNRKFQTLQSRVRRALDMKVGSLSQAQESFEGMVNLIEKNHSMLERSANGRRFLTIMSSIVAELGPRLGEHATKKELERMHTQLKNIAKNCDRIVKMRDFDERELEEELDQAHNIANTLHSPRFRDLENTQKVMKEYNTLRRSLRRSLQRSILLEEETMGVLRREPSPKALRRVGSPSQTTKTRRPSVDISSTMKRPQTTPSKFQSPQSTTLLERVSTSHGRRVHDDSASVSLFLPDHSKSSILAPLDFEDDSSRPVASKMSPEEFFTAKTSPKSKSTFVSPIVAFDPTFRQEKVQVFSPVARKLVETPMTKSLASMPRLLDPSAMTVAAAFPNSDYHQTPVDRIGSYFSQHSADMTFEQIRGGSVTSPRRRDRLEPIGSDDELRRMEDDMSTITEDDEERFNERYLYYAMHMPSDSALPSFPQEDFGHVLDLVPDRAPLVAEEFVDDLVRDTASGMKETFVFAVRKSILDYVLLNPKERRRLGILVPPGQIKKSIFAVKPPTTPCSWHQRVAVTKNFIGQNLCLLDPSLLELLGHIDDLPVETSVCADFRPETEKRYPVSLEDFVATQREAMSFLRSEVSSSWIPPLRSSLLQRISSETLTDDMKKHILHCASGLIANSNRKIADQTARAWSSHFTEVNRITPIFRISLELVQGNSMLSFEPKTNDIVEEVSTVFDEAITSLVEECRLVVDKKTFKVDVISLADDVLSHHRSLVIEKLKSDLAESWKQVQVYAPYLWIVDGSGMRNVRTFLSGHHEFEEFEAEVNRIRSVGDELKEKLPPHLYAGVFQIDALDVIGLLFEGCRTLVEVILNHIASEAATTSGEVAKAFDDLETNITRTPKQLEEFVAMQTYIRGVRVILDEQDKKLKLMKHKLRFLLSVDHPLTDVQISATSIAILWPSRMKPIIDESHKKMETYREKFDQQLDEKLHKFETELNRLLAQAESFHMRKDPQAFDKNMDEINDILNNLKEAEKKTPGFNEQESMLNRMRSSFLQIQDARKVLEPYEKIWALVQEGYVHIDEWMNGNYRTFVPDEIEKEVGNVWRGAMKLLKTLPEDDMESARFVLTVLKERYDKFKEDMPQFLIFANPGMRDRHWKVMSDKLKIHIHPSAQVTFSDVLRLQLGDYIDVMEEVAGIASKEYMLERTLDRMEEEWKPVDFTLVEWRDTKTCILSSIDDIQQLLDDHIVKTQTMRCSPFIGPFEERVIKWESILTSMQDILDEWLKVQATWLYLESIFSSPDIQKQMPNEHSMFTRVDRTWRDTMSDIQRNPHCVDVAQREGMLGEMKECNELLEKIQAGLNQYLEMKRLFFPRFFFLSNDELLEILSETKDPLRIQPHLKKCFEGIAKLEFQDNLDITGMWSSEQEYVKLSETINPTAAQGAVEKWLVEVERVMILSLKNVIKESVDDYQKSTGQEWIKKWPGQVILCVDQIYWTQSVTKKLMEGGGGKELREYAQEYNDNLLSIAELVRGELPLLLRLTLGNLVVIGIHARDVTTQLADKNVESLVDFDWQSQLRYYVENDDVVVRMTNATISYGYEYLGNSMRLVITPLTDRCYRTLMGALHLNLGGAPEGPAGTGKTETVKDLAKAAARQCVVFNCSDGLDYIAMGKFFKGLASAGAWSCFDEFNRIDLEVLSVVAQQILTIQRAKAAGLTNFVFEGTHLQLKDSTNVFITMNPGYAGRSELPDNLKALFRPVAMMVPNYAMIAEISLYSFGFRDAKPLSNKIVAVYRLCSEQLSSQDHYDYGMRAVKTVLTAAGNLKRRYPEQSEDILVLRSIIDVNLPKFLQQDIELFNGITSDLFPNVKLPAPDYEDLLKYLNENIHKMGLQPVPAFIEKILQLYEVICVRHGLMIVGYSFSGKTCAYRVLAAALGDLEKAGIDEHAVQIHVLNPKSVTMGQLYGNFDPVSHEWTDGVLAKTFRHCASDTSTDRKWLMFDGPVDAIWIENMNTVLDDNKKLCLMSGEIMQMSSTMNMIFEVQDLAVASPATVSRCGMIYMEPSAMGWEPLFKSWVQTMVPECLQKRSSVMELIENLQGWLIPPCLHFIRRECREPAPTSDINLVNSLIRIFECMFVRSFDPAKDESKPDRDVTIMIENSFIFALLWSIGGSVDTASRFKFDAFLRRVLNSDTPDPYGKFSTALPIMLTSRVPHDGLLFDYQFDLGKMDWVRWIDTISRNVKIPSDALFSQITIPTIDTARYTFLLKLLLFNNKPVMLCGPTGTGKTVYIKNFLLNELGEDHAPIFANFSAQTTSNQIQEIIEGRLDRRRKGVYGPPLGKTYILFVDDVNMPAKEFYGAQPPVELLRQFLDHHGWFDVAGDKSFRKIIDVLLVTAMGPPGGGRTFITPRFMRHFNFVSVTEFDDETSKSIFSSILGWYFRSKNFAGEVVSAVDPLIHATLHIYKSVMKDLLPTPSKSHYIFNLRDYGRVIQGMLLSAPRHVANTKSLLRLWTHEVLRVFGDRLADEADSEWLSATLSATVKETFQEDLYEILKDLDKDEVGKVDATLLRGIIFGDYLDPGAGDRRTYREITDMKRLTRVMENYLGDFNQLSKKPMDLVMFPFAIEHVSRVCRVLKQPGSHALLVGVGGSGRQSLARLAAHIVDYELFQIEISSNYGMEEWREDIKGMMLEAW
eukprot:TRINITY_DN1424_c1_g1_i1.p1 TRINITY_DN1424_c1_g1~~TRINITY_DN1424_c1_g1_i1.p1  ORF type:complete len:2631 (-),score=647.35 TRINITY_DN1424_c1_g1_i1:5218-13110(-)